MTLAEISPLLESRLSKPLPASAAHDRMRATSRGKLRPKIDNTNPPRPGAVLILLYEDDGLIRFPLIQRAEYVGAHSGQISLPGGKSEQGEVPIETALRETEEEIGIDRHSPNVLGALSNFLVIPSNFMITPVVATLAGTPIFRPDPHEVAGLLLGTLEELVHEEAIKEKEIVVSGQFRMMAPHFEIENNIVWGATAMVLNELRAILREILER